MTFQQANFYLRRQYTSNPAIRQWPNRMLYRENAALPAPSVANLGLDQILDEKTKKQHNLITEPMGLIDTSILDEGWDEGMFKVTGAWVWVWLVIIITE